jgi:hypothetical protein
VQQRLGLEELLERAQAVQAPYAALLEPALLELVDDSCAGVDGEVRQHARISDLVFGVEQLVADVCAIVTVRPGEIIATGTSGGVADAMDPPAYLRPGQVCEVSITGLGTLRNVFGAAAAQATELSATAGAGVQR